jgi:hypothetical protein
MPQAQPQAEPAEVPPAEDVPDRAYERNERLPN